MRQSFCAVFSWSVRTTDRVFRKAKRGLATVGATLLETEQDGANCVETYRIPSNGRTLVDLQRLLSTYGIDRVYWGQGRVMGGVGAGECPKRSNLAAQYRANRKTLDAMTFKILQTWRSEARAELERLNGDRRLKPNPANTTLGRTTRKQLQQDSQLNRPTHNYKAQALVAELEQVKHQQDSILELWDNGTIPDCSESLVNEELRRLSREAQTIVERLSVA